ncbi:YopX family protein [Bacillus mycoides]|uniref:YopX family protein n=1 Tax=Bacillus mycoides TaxID=1405 RepID=UPI001319F67C|nr:YopX family protein [Bacillus mycoides]
MREIKFRLYRKTSKEMISWEKLCKNPFELSILKDNEENERWSSFMQYTGLKDSKGNEIYEGDILKVPSINDHVHGNYSYKEVIYRNGTWIAQYIKSEKGQVVPRGYIAGHLIDCYDHDYKALVFYDDRLEHTDIEIIGNIHENADLLDGGKNK